MNTKVTILLSSIFKVLEVRRIEINWLRSIVEVTFYLINGYKFGYGDSYGQNCWGKS